MGVNLVESTDAVDLLVGFMTPVISDVLRRIAGDEFTTGEFVDLLQHDAAGAVAYRTALDRWGEGDHRSKMVVHGQVIPVALRRSGLVEWLGFAYGDDDTYGVPARWRLRSDNE